MSVANHEITNPTQHDSFAQVMQRRAFLQGLATTASVVAVNAITGQRTEAAQSGLNFASVALSNEDRIITPSSYRASTVIRWGDPILPGVPAFDVNNQTAVKQAGQFGYNCDFLYLIEFAKRPFATRRRESACAGLLWVNHEYTNPELMFVDYKGGNPTKEQVDIELAAHGGTLVQIERVQTKVFGQPEWTPDVYSPFNRRITAETLCQITGPAAGHSLLKTSADATGTRVIGS